MNEKIKITPEMRDQACDLVASVLMKQANEIGLEGANMTAMREKFASKPSPYCDIQELAAQMLLGLGKAFAEQTIPFEVSEDIEYAQFFWKDGKETMH